jgi:hypothetical protein
MSTNRITEKQLQAIVERINRVTGSPMEPYTNGRANIGHYHLSFAYGGVELHRMVNMHGGVTCPFGGGHVPKRELAQRMWAFLAELGAKAEAAA